MGVIADQLHAIAVQVAALEAGVPAPPPVTPPPVTPPPVTPPSSGPASTASIVAAARAAGYAGAVVQIAVVPPNGYNEYRVSPRVDEVLVIAFQAPPADLSFQVTYVRLAGAGGSRLSILSERYDTYDKSSPDAIAWTDAPDMSLRLASMPSPYSRYALVPGRWYYVICASRLPIDPSLPAMQPLSIKVLNSKP